MTIKDCPNCGGTHYGSMQCPFTSTPCVICFSTLAQQCKNYPANPNGLRPRMLETIAAMTATKRITPNEQGNECTANLPRRSP
jgi:hypothetical protein